MSLVSAHNPLIKQVRRAASRGALTDDGFALAEGPHLLEEARRSGVEIGAVIAAESARTIPEAGEARVMQVADATFAGLASTGTTQGVLALVRPRAWTLEDVLRGTPLVVVLDAVQDPGNAGAIVRAAEAFQATGVVFRKGSVNPYNPKCLRGSAGSIFRMPVVTAEDLTGLALPLFAAEANAKAAVTGIDLTEACGIVIGAEGRGVSPELAAKAIGVRIPTSGVESLNAAVAAGILLYEASRQRGLS